MIAIVIRLGVVLALLLLPLWGADAQTIALHSGATDPATEGWQRALAVGTEFVIGGGPHVNVTEGAIPGDLGFDAWTIDDDGTGVDSNLAQLVPLTAQQRTDALTNGFFLRARVRVADTPDPDALGSVFFDFLDGVNRFGIRLGSEADGDAFLVPAGGSAIVLEGKGSTYVDYLLEYDPVTSLANVFADGNLVLTGYAGTAFAHSFPTVAFGSGRNIDTGEGRYASVRFGVLPAVSVLPRGLGWILPALLLGLLAVTWRRGLRVQ